MEIHLGWQSQGKNERILSFVSKDRKLVITENYKKFTLGVVIRIMHHMNRTTMFHFRQAYQSFLPKNMAPVILLLGKLKFDPEFNVSGYWMPIELCNLTYHLDILRKKFLNSKLQRLCST